jgi:vacuolar protein sorting-associated protein 26
MASLFGFGPSAKVEIELAGTADGEKRKTIKVDGGADNTKMELPIFTHGESIEGTVRVVLPPGKKMDHIGIRLEIIGIIDLFYDRSNSQEFTSRCDELETQGQLDKTKEYSFKFDNVNMQYESYTGTNVQLRYYLRATVQKGSYSQITKEQDLWVQGIGEKPEINNSIKMEVGIEDCLHIEFEYDKQKYHMKDCILGKIYFLLVRIKIKHMEVAIVRRETISGANGSTQNDTVTKFEVMDGAPIRGESIPIRLFLDGYDLTPTYKMVNNKFSVRYYINLVLVDEEDRRYFKQQEINLWRHEIG